MIQAQPSRIFHPSASVIGLGMALHPSMGLLIIAGTFLGLLGKTVPFLLGLPGGENVSLEVLGLCHLMGHHTGMQNGELEKDTQCPILT